MCCRRGVAIPCRGPSYTRQWVEVSTDECLFNSFLDAVVCGASYTLQAERAAQVKSVSGLSP